MDEILNPEHFDAPHIGFGDLPKGMAEKLEVGDKIVAKKDGEETAAHVIEIDHANGCVYLEKDLPAGADYSVEQTSTGSEAPYDAMRKAAASSDSGDGILTGPLPKLKDFLIQISIRQGE